VLIEMFFAPGGSPDVRAFRSGVVAVVLAGLAVGSTRVATGGGIVGVTASGDVVSRIGADGVGLGSPIGMRRPGVASRLAEGWASPNPGDTIAVGDGTRAPFDGWLQPMTAIEAITTTNPDRPLIASIPTIL
jgi:hypothetical protein